MNRRTITQYALKVNATVLFFSLPILSFANKPTKADTHDLNRDRHRHTVAKALHWKPDNSRCQGTFQPNPWQLQPGKPTDFAKSATTLHSRGPTTIHPNGTSVLQDNVIIRQPGRYLHAQHATVFRNPDNGEITRIQLRHQVRIAEPHQLISAHQATVNHANNTLSLDTVYYRLYQHVSDQLHYGWGEAKHFIRDQYGNLFLKQASYSTCSPLKPAWQLNADAIDINTHQHVGAAHNVTLNFYDTPVFYFPYFTFPTNNARKSGFLYPFFNQSSHSGLQVSIPYYWNMAPNYDSTWTTTGMTKRGLQLNTEFRYLSQLSSLTVNTSIMPYDAEFRRFKNDLIALNLPDKDAFTSRLADMPNYRGYLGLTQSITLSPALSSSLILNLASDPYYLNQLNILPAANRSSQLLNQLTVSYRNYHWQIASTLQAYQTLHQIDQADAYDQYQRLPEVDINGFYDHLPYDANFTLPGQYTNFHYHSAFGPAGYYTKDKSIGQRLHLKPTVSLPLHSKLGVITPSIAIDSTNYDSQLGEVNAHRPQRTLSRNIPILSLRSDSQLLRDVHIANDDYWQTLEPTLQYTFIPYVNQQQSPNFDTATAPFTFNQIFQDNGFSGVDRVQNTSQLGIGLTSRLLSQRDGSQLIRADLGSIVYFNQRRVCLDQTCEADKHLLSPIVGGLTLDPFTAWQANLSLAIDPNKKQVNNSALSANYQGQDQRQLNLRYQYIRSTSGEPIRYQLSPNSQLAQVGAAWPLSTHYFSIGYYQYNLSERRPQAGLIGVSYDSCCWMARLSYTQEFNHVDPSSTVHAPLNRYNHSIMLQIMLKGLGNVGTSNASQAIQGALPGYNDPF